MYQQDQKSLDNQLLESSKKLYYKKPERILKPLNTSTRSKFGFILIFVIYETKYFTVYGYMRPSRLFTTTTTYQDDIGRKGFYLLQQS